MARRNTHRRTSTNDPRLLREIMSMPPRDSLPQEGPEEVPVTYEGMDVGTPVDRRSPERKAWDKRMEALQKRIKARDDKDRKARESAEKAYVESKAAGRPMDENGNPIEDTAAQETTEEQTTKPAMPARPANQLANGTRQVKPAGGQQGGQQGKSPARKPSALGSVGIDRYGRQAGWSGYTVDGVPISKGNTAAVVNAESAAAARTQTEYIRNRRELEREQADAKSDPRRNYQKYANDQFDLDRSMDDLRERKRAYREEQEQRRKDRRFQNRDLSNADDWNNLGREGSNRRNYEATADETADQKKDREAAVEARNKQIAALRDRFAQMSDKTLLKEGEKYEWKNGRAVVSRPVGSRVDENGKPVIGKNGKPEQMYEEVSAAELAQRKDSGVGPSEYSYGNKFYANDPNRQKELAALGKLVNAAAEGKTISDAQIEAATKKLDSWQAEADERGARVQSYQNMRNAEQVSGLRRQYGLTDKQAFSDADVMDYHRSQQKAARTEILKGMQVAPGATPERLVPGEGGQLNPDGSISGNASRGYLGKSAMTKFSGQWQKLLDSGFDPQATFAKAMQNADNKKAYMEGLASISSSDPDAADKRDQLRRRFIMNQAMEEHGIKQTGGESGQAGAQMAAGTLAQNLPGRKVLFNSRGEAEANQARMESLGGPQSTSPGDVQGALKPKRADGPDEVTVQAPAAQAVAPVKQTAAPPEPEVPVVPRKKKKDEEAQAAARGGVSALRPRRRG